MPSNADLERARYLAMLGLSEAQAVSLSNSDLRTLFIAGGGIVPSSQSLPEFTAEDHNYKGWNFDPALTSAGQVVTLGALHLIKIKVIKAVSVSNIAVFCSTAGATLTAGQCLAGLYNQAGDLLGTSPDQSSAWTSAGLKNMSISPVNLAAGNYYVGLLANGTTAPSFSRAASSGIGNAGLAAPNMRSSTTGSALTALPAPASMGSQVAYSAHFWAAVS